jgi:hypothetical protein
MNKILWNSTVGCCGRSWLSRRTFMPATSTVCQPLRSRMSVWVSTEVITDECTDRHRQERRLHDLGTSRQLMTFLSGGNHFDFCCSIHVLVRASSRSRGSSPPSTISSWNVRISNLGPNSF